METITSAVSNTAATSRYEPDNAPLRKKGVSPNKVFMVAAGDVSPA